jgi:hypothetical protein
MDPEMSADQTQPAPLRKGLGVLGVLSLLSTGLSLSLTAIGHYHMVEKWHFRPGSWADFFLDTDAKFPALIVAVVAIKLGFLAAHPGRSLVYRFLPLLVSISTIHFWSREYLF